MKFSVTGSTERGSLVLFWPALLPADFEQRWAEEPAELGDELQTTGKVIWFSCDANGESSLGLFVDEPVPEGLQTFCTLSEKVEALQAAGEGWFCGAEAVFRDDRSYLDQHPRKGSAVQVPAGKYLAEVFTTEIPDSVYEDWIKTEAGSRAQQLWWIQTWFASTGIVAAMICVGCLFVGTQEMTLAAFVGSAILLFIGWLLSLTPGYQRVQQARREYAAAFPNFVVRLRTAHQ